MSGENLPCRQTDRTTSGTAHVLVETTAPRRKTVGSSPYIGLAEGADHGLEWLGLRAVAGLVVALALRHEDRELCFGQGHAGACMATWSASCAVAAVHPPSSPMYPAVRAPRRRGGPPPCRPWLDLCRPHVVGWPRDSQTISHVPPHHPNMHARGRYVLSVPRAAAWQDGSPSAPPAAGCRQRSVPGALVDAGARAAEQNLFVPGHVVR